jgi:hypothetical protein
MPERIAEEREPWYIRRAGEEVITVRSRAIDRIPGLPDVVADVEVPIRTDLKKLAERSRSIITPIQKE